MPELQSIRGLAALAVLLHHSSFLFTTSRQFHFYSEALINTHAAVMMFFVLSGYVLVRSLNGRALTVESCARFYIARLFRIYPALWSACVIAVAYLVAVHFRGPILQASEWYKQFFNQFPSIADVAENMVAANFALVPPTWSVRVELFASAAIPLICFMARRGFGLPLLGGSIALAPILAQQTMHTAGFLIYMPSFILGALAFRYQDRLARMLGKPSALAASAAVLLFFRLIDPAWRFDSHYNAILPTLIESVAAALLIVGIVARPIPLLQRRLLTRLGDISYSLYLVHFIVMSGLARLICGISINQDIRAVMLMLGTLAVSWPLSAILYSCIEKPGIRIGGILSDRLLGKLQANPA